MSEHPLDRVQTIRCDAYNDDPLRVARVAQVLPEGARLNDAAVLFAALAHPVRVRIVAALAREPLCVCELAALLDMSPPAVMHHLKALAAAGMIDVRKVGRFAEYRLVDRRACDVLDVALSESVPIGGKSL